MCANYSNHDHQVDLVMPEICPKSASLRNFILQRPYSVMTPLPLPVITHRLRTRVTLASRGWSASCSFAFCWTISGRSLFFTMAFSCKRSLACLATHFLLALSLLIIFSKPRVGVVLMALTDNPMMLVSVQQLRVELERNPIRRQPIRAVKFLIPENILSSGLRDAAMWGRVCANWNVVVQRSIRNSWSWRNTTLEV